MTKQELLDTINELIILGEDKDELSYWFDVYDDLELDKQIEVSSNLKQELEELKQPK